VEYEGEWDAAQRELGLEGGPTAGKKGGDKKMTTDRVGEPKRGKKRTEREGGGPTRHGVKHASVKTVGRKKGGSS